ncbi:MAG: glycosyltransferase family 4 protein [Cryomorphaceae bacterium]|nr:glycosyltransferase family 4 protein [Cryomorphaceae bacterium]
MNRVLYVFQKPNILVKRDIEMLGSEYIVDENEFKYNNKINVIYAIFKDIKKVFTTWDNTTYCLIVVRFAGYHGLIPLLFARIKKIPALVIVGGTDAARLPGINYGNYRSKLLGWITNLNYYLAKNAVFVHESLIEQKYTYDKNEPLNQGVKSFFKGHLNCYIVYNGYKANIYKPDNTIDRKNKSCITAAGNLSTEVMVKRKGVDIILEAAKVCPDFSFTLVGSNRLPESYYPIPENVTLINFLDTDDLIKAFSSHQYYIQTSMFEGFPNALAEAMLCECIPIGSNVSGIPFIIQNTGFVINKRSASLLAQTLKNAKKLNNKLPRKRIEENFTWQNRIDNFLNAVKTISKSKK